MPATNKFLVECEKEKQIQVAIAKVLEEREEEAVTGKKGSSIRYIAATCGIPRTTLTARLQGRQTRSEAHVQQQKLSPTEEDVLAAFMKKWGRRGIPFTHPAILERASLIADEPVGVNWIYRFLTRHPDIAPRWSSPLPSSRANGLNEAATAQYFEEFQKIVTDFDIPVENIYNMDEKGNQESQDQKWRVFIDREQRTAYNLQGDDRENITTLECVSADGACLPFMAIYKGKRFVTRWGDGNEDRAM